MKAWLIFRWSYSVREIWGPYVQNEPPMDELDNIAASRGVVRDFFSVQEIDHYIESEYKARVKDFLAQSEQEEYMDTGKALELLQEVVK